MDFFPIFKFAVTLVLKVTLMCGICITNLLNVLDSEEISKI